MKELLEKYFEGETSLAEEKQLMNYFQSENISPELEKYKPLFISLQSTENEHFTFDESIFKKTKKRSLYFPISVAASFLIVVVTAFYIHEKNQQEQAEIAYHQVKEAFYLLSENYNKGAEKMEYLAEFNKAKEKIFKISNK